MTEHSEMLALAQKYVDQKYISRADERQKAMGIAYVTAERTDLARELVNFARLAASRPATQVVDREAVARVLCQSGKFETGQGTCAVLCMDQLDDVRKRAAGIAPVSMASLPTPSSPFSAPPRQHRMRRVSRLRGSIAIVLLALRLGAIGATARLLSCVAVLMKHRNALSTPTPRPASRAKQRRCGRR